MPDTSVIRNYINNNITTNGNGEVTGDEVRQSFLQLCDVVDGIITTFAKVGGVAMPTSNADDIYHTGKLIVGRNTDDNLGNKVQIVGGANVEQVKAAELHVYSGQFNSIWATNTDGQYPAPVSSPGNANLAMGANYTSGGSDLAFISTNLMSFGMTFWQLLTATTKQLLLTLKGGYVGIGNTNPTSSLHVNGPNGVFQFRLEQSYTPGSSTDSNGNQGQFVWDSNYIYIKITATTWKRVALSSF